MKNKLIVLLSIITLLLITTPIRFQSITLDLFLSPLLCCGTAYYFFKKGLLKAGGDYFVIPGTILFVYILAIGIDAIFSSVQKIEWFSIGTPNIVMMMLGSICGGLLYGQQKKKGYAIAILSLIFVTWYLSTGSTLWINFLSYGTVDGIPEKKQLKGWKQTMHNIDNGELILNEKDKLIVLDFWSVSCVACFKKFPGFDSLTRNYTHNKNISFYTINLPMQEGDTIKWKRIEAFKKKYSFNNAVADTNAAKIFNIYAVPLIIVMRNDSLLFRGSLELLPGFLEKNIKIDTQSM